MAFLRDKQEMDTSQFQMNKIEIIRQKFEECKRLREGNRSGLGLGLGLEGTSIREKGSSFLL